MGYGGISSLLINKSVLVDNVINSIKDIDFDSIWSSTASLKLLSRLDQIIEKVEQEKSNLQVFANALSKVQRIVEIDAELASLYSQLAAINSDDEECAGAIAVIQAQISRLQAEREELRKEVISMLSVFGVIDKGSSFSGNTGNVNMNTEKNNNQVATNKVNINEKDDKKDNLMNMSQSGSDYKGEVLTARKGYIENGPSGSETFCPDQPVGAIKIMMGEDHGYSDLELYYRDDGVTLVRGVDPNGEKFEDLVAVAADIYDEPSGRLDGVFKRGDIVETSLGTAMVVDYCERAENMRKADGSVHFDIFTAWHDPNERWYHEIYGKNK